LACSRSHVSQPIRTAGASCPVSGCLSHAACTAFHASNSLALRRGQRVRDSCSCQYIRGNSTSSIHCRHAGVRSTWCCTSCHTRCHHTSTRADTPASCLQTLSRTFFLPGNPLVAINVSIAWISACNWHSTSAAVCRVESTRRHGCTSHDTASRWGRYVLCTFSPSVTAASLVSTKACARWSSGLSGMGRLAGVEAFLRLLQGLLRLSQT